MTMPPWLLEIVACCEAGISTGDLTLEEAQALISLWAERLA